MGAVAKFATAGVAPAERLRYWNTVADQVFCGTFINAEAQRFEGEMWSWSVGDLDIIRTRSAGASVGRRPAATSAERLIMHMQWRGQGQHCQAGREASLSPGDFVLGSPHEPYRFELSPHELVAVEFPKAALLERVPDLDDALASRLPGGSPAVRMFHDFLLSLWRQAQSADSSDPAWAPGISSVFYDLAALAIAEARRTHTADGDLTLQTRCLSLIDASLGDPDLSTAALAEELGTSARTVQNLFARCGTTPSAEILSRRLKSAAERLMAEPDRTITQIAFDHGFNDSAYFTRCFRNWFGMSPREWRLGRLPDMAPDAAARESKSAFARVQAAPTLPG